LHRVFLLFFNTVSGISRFGNVKTDNKSRANYNNIKKRKPGYPWLKSKSTKVLARCHGWYYDYDFFFVIAVGAVANLSTVPRQGRVDRYVLDVDFYRNCDLASDIPLVEGDNVVVAVNGGVGCVALRDLLVDSLSASGCGGAIRCDCASSCLDWWVYPGCCLDFCLDFSLDFTALGDDTGRDYWTARYYRARTAAAR
jgi:hypothetical protein